MNIWLSGAFGNLGSHVLDALLAQEFTVTCFDLPNKANQKKAAAYQGRAKIIWGDIRDREAVAESIRDMDALIHMAAIIPPLTEIRPDFSWSVNVDATRQLLELMAELPQQPLLVFASSFAVFGYRQHEPPPRKLNESVEAVDHYSKQKIACEELIQQLADRWCILRLGASADESLQHAGRDLLQMMFALSADNRVEFVHPKDVATAMVHAVQRPEAHNRIHLIGGGQSCQVHHIDLVNAMTGAIGFTFREQDFASQPLYADWADTAESQRLLDFQHHSFARLRETAYRKYALLRFFVRPLAPLIRFVMKRLFGPGNQR